MRTSDPSTSSSASSRGFTLVEVMVAVAVFALALPALIGSMINVSSGTEHMRKRSIAQWVAANRMTEIRLLHEYQNTMPKDDSDGVVEMNEKEWHWHVKVEKMEAIDNYFLVTVSVFEDKDDENPVTYLENHLGNFQR